FHSLKVEAVHGETFTTREAMRQTVFGYIETFYNTRRRHSNNDYVSPMQFEDDFYQKLAS
ncbi:MAG: IS3 family transposase, partial [bacterium]